MDQGEERTLKRDKTKLVLVIDISLEYARPRYLWMLLTAVTLPVLDVRGLTISKYLNPKVQMFEMYELIDCRDSFTKIILNMELFTNL